MIIHYMPQQSPEWFDIKSGKMSASHATAIGNNGKGLDTYIRQIVKEMICGKKESYTNKDIERGNELEPIGRIAYEFEYGCAVDQVGFIEYNQFVGCSPDGLIGTDGGLELKARNEEIHLGLLLGDSVDSSTIWQMNMCMLLTGRSWWDFGSYNSNFKHSLFVQRFTPDIAKFEKLLIGFASGEEMLKKLLSNPNIQKELLK